MFYLIGLGLGDPSDIGLRGQQIIQKCERVYLEAYTSILLHGAKDALELFHGRPILLADREQVEQGAAELLSGAETQDVALLVVGDPLGATTHTDLMLRAKETNILVSVISNASVLTAAAITGLDMTRFGEVVSIPFWDDTWRPESFCDKICVNLLHGLHTLCLLDIKVKEQSIENILRNRKVFEPPRFMRTDQAAQQLLDTLESRRQRQGQEAEDGSITPADCCSLLTPDTLCVSCVRLGTKEQHNVVASLQEVAERDLGAPLHSLVVCAPLTELEDRHCRAFTTHFTGGPCTSDQELKKTSGHFYLVGMGLALRDMTVKGMQAIKQCSTKLLDERTRLILKGIHGKDSSEVLFGNLEQFSVEDAECLVNAFDLESEGFQPTCSDSIMEELKSGKDVVVIVWGDPLVFTEYNTLIMRLTEEKLDFTVLHNASILNNVASCGLQLYTFGETIQVPFMQASDLDASKCKAFIDDENSFYNKIIRNQTNGWHSLCLLHVLKEDSAERKAHFLSPCEAADILMRIVTFHASVSPKIASSGSHRASDDSAVVSSLSTKAVVVGVAGLGHDQEHQLKTATLETLAQSPEVYHDCSPAYAMLIAGKTHPLEDECLALLTQKISMTDQ